MQVKLAPYEMLFAAQVGLRRNIEAILAGKSDFAGFDGPGWNNHIEGACGEMAVSKALNVYWTPSVNTYREGGDVGLWQVRTRSEDHFDLTIRARDVNEKPDTPFILIVGRAPSFTVIGWTLAKDAVRDEWKHTYGNRPVAWFVPQQELRPMRELPR